MSNVKTIRISSGEDIVAEVVSDSEYVIVLKNIIVAIPNGKSMQIGFAPWSPLLDPDQEITIKKQFVVYVSVPNSQVLEHYNSMFNKIVAPENKIIV